MRIDNILFIIVIMSNTNRKIEYDIFKGVGILLVLIGHAIPSSGFVHNLIYGFHMPLFFFCSGVFFKEKPMRDAIIKDLRTLMIPYVMFSVFLIVCAIILYIWSNGQRPELRPFDENCYVLYYTIWFLPCLFITKLLYRFISRSQNELIISFLCIVGYLLAYSLKYFEINIPFFMDSAMSMLLFYHCGYMFTKYGLMDRRIPIWLSLLFLAGYIALVWFVQPRINIKENIYPCYLILLAIAPIYAVYQLCCCCNSRFLAYCGEASIAIMGFHHPLYDVAMFPLMNRIHLPLFIESVMIVCTTLFLTLLIYQLLLNNTPYLLGKAS